MILDLHEIIHKTGTVPFSYDLSTDRLDFPFVAAYRRPPHAEGKVVNSAGALTLRGVLTAEMLCVCDRCTAAFERRMEIPLELPLAADLEDSENPDVFLLDGDGLDLDEVLETCFILGMDGRSLCRPDCAGLCPDCGADLNEGPCGCTGSHDPRLAVLEQLLDDKIE
jgi:uncharacterized protein